MSLPLHCPVCHADYPPGSRICTADGTPLVEKSREAQGLAPVAAPTRAVDEAGVAAVVVPPYEALDDEALDGRAGESVGSAMPALWFGLLALSIALGAGTLRYTSAGAEGERRVTVRSGSVPEVAAAPVPLAGEIVDGDGVETLEDAAFGGGRADAAFSDEGALPASDETEAAWAPRREREVVGGRVMAEAPVPGGVAAVLRTPDRQVRLVMDHPRGRFEAPRPFPMQTRVRAMQHRQIEGRDVVEVQTVDGRTQRHYVWEYAPNRLHALATDLDTGDATLSETPGAAEVLEAALGELPEGLTRDVRETGETPEPQDEAAELRDAVYVILGAYPPGDPDGLDARRRELSASRRPIRTGVSDEMGLRPGYRVLYLGPFERDQGEQTLALMKRYASDAYLRAVPDLP